MNKLKEIINVSIGRNRNGIDSTNKLIAEMCVKPTTYYYKLRHRSFTHSELIRLFKILNLTDAEIIEVMRT